MLNMLAISSFLDILIISLLYTEDSDPKLLLGAFG